MNIIIRDCVKGIQSGIDGSEYRYLGTGFNTQDQVRSLTRFPFPESTSSVTELSHTLSTRNLVTLGYQPPGSPSSSSLAVFTSTFSKERERLRSVVIQKSSFFFGKMSENPPLDHEFFTEFTTDPKGSSMERYHSRGSQIFDDRHRDRRRRSDSEDVNENFPSLRS